MSPTITVALTDGTEATWWLSDDSRADAVTQALTALLGRPDSIRT